MSNTLPRMLRRKQPLEKFYQQVHQVLNSEEGNKLHILLKDYQVNGRISSLASGLFALLDTPSKRQLFPQIRKLLPPEHRKLFDECLSNLRNGGDRNSLALHIQSPILERKNSSNQMQQSPKSIRSTRSMRSTKSLPRSVASGHTTSPRRKKIYSNGVSADLMTNDLSLLLNLTVHCPPGAPLGFSIRGGSENGLGIYVSHTEPGTSSERAGLLTGDHILEVNSIDMQAIRSRSAVQVLTGSSMLRMRIRRLRKLPEIKGTRERNIWYDTALGHVVSGDYEQQNGFGSTHSLHSVDALQRRIHMQTKRNQEFRGFNIRGGVEYGLGIYVSRVDRGGLAEKNGLRVGDLIARVNGDDVSQVNHAAVVQLLRQSPSLILSVQHAGRYPAYRETFVEYVWVDAETGYGTTSRPVSMMDNLPITSRQTFQSFPSDSRADTYGQTDDEQTEDEDDEDLIATWNMLSQLSMQEHMDLRLREAVQENHVEDRQDMLLPHSSDIVMLERLDPDEHQEHSSPHRSKLAVQALQAEALAHEHTDKAKTKKDTIRNGDSNSYQWDENEKERRKSQSFKERLFGSKSRKKSEETSKESREMSFLKKMRGRSKQAEYDLSGSNSQGHRIEIIETSLQQEDADSNMYDELADGNISFSDFDPSVSSEEVYPGLRKGSNVSADEESDTYPGLRKSTLVDKEVVVRPTSPNAKHIYEIQRPTGTSKVYKARMDNDVEYENNEMIIGHGVESYGNGYKDTIEEHITMTNGRPLTSKSPQRRYEVNGHNTSSKDFDRSDRSSDVTYFDSPTTGSHFDSPRHNNGNSHVSEISQSDMYSLPDKHSHIAGSYNFGRSSSIPGISEDNVEGGSDGIQLIRRRRLNSDYFLQEHKQLHEKRSSDEEVSLYWDTSSGTGMLTVTRPESSDSPISSRSDSPAFGSYDVTPPNESPVRQQSMDISSPVDSNPSPRAIIQTLTPSESPVRQKPVPARRTSIKQPTGMSKYYINGASSSGGSPTNRYDREQEEEERWQEWVEEDVTEEVITQTTSVRNSSSYDSADRSKSSGGMSTFHNPLLEDEHPTTIKAGRSPAHSHSRTENSTLSHGRMGLGNGADGNSISRNMANSNGYRQDQNGEDTSLTRGNFKQKDDDAISTTSWNNLRQISKSMSSFKSSPSKSSVMNESSSWADIRGSTPPPRSISPDYEDSIHQDTSFDESSLLNLSQNHQIHDSDEEDDPRTYSSIPHRDSRTYSPKTYRSTHPFSQFASSPKPPREFADHPDNGDISIALTSISEIEPHSPRGVGSSPILGRAEGYTSPTRGRYSSPNRDRGQSSSPTRGRYSSPNRGGGLFSSPNRSPTRGHGSELDSTPTRGHFRKHHEKSNKPRDWIEGYDHTIVVEQPLMVLIAKTKKSLGMSISGGSNSRSQPQVRIKDILPGGAAAQNGILKAGMRIISVDGFSLQFASHTQAVAAIRNAYMNRTRPHMELQVLP